jgi:hypothetical protein
MGKGKRSRSLRWRLSSLTLSDGERNALARLRDHAIKPYQREWAAALVKLADGDTIHNPDPDYDAKRAHIAACLERAAQWWP